MVSLIGRRIPTTGIEGAQAGGLGDVFGKFAQILSDPLTPAIKRENLSALNRQNLGTESFAARAAQGNWDPAAATADAIRAGIDPGHLAGYDVYSTTKRYGPESPQAFTAAMARPGAVYGSTIQGTREDFANQLEKQKAQEATRLAIEAQKPTTVLVNGIPTVVRQDRSYGQPGSVPLSEQQGAFASRYGQTPEAVSALPPAAQAIIGAQPRASEAYNVGLPGGGSQAMTLGANGLEPITYQGQPVPSIGKLVGATSDAFGKGDPIEKDLYNAEVFTAQASNAIDKLSASLAQPDAGAAVGALGTGARVLNDVLAQARAFSQLMSGEDVRALESPAVQNSIDRAMASVPPVVAQRAQQLGIDATMMRSQITNLGHMIARAQNPSGQVTENDFRRAADTLGTSLQDPLAMSKVLNEVKTSLHENLRIRKDVFQRTRGTTPPGGVPPPAVDFKSKYGLE